MFGISWSWRIRSLEFRSKSKSTDFICMSSVEYWTHLLQQDWRNMFHWNTLQSAHDKEDMILGVHKSLPPCQPPMEQLRTTSSNCEACQSALYSLLSPEPSNKTPLSPWFTIFSVTDPPPSTPPLGLVLHQASASLKSRLELTFKNPTTPGTFLRMRHWASQSSKSQDVGCWRALRTSLSFYYKTQSKHSKHFRAVSGSTWMS